MQNVSRSCLYLIWNISDFPTCSGLFALWSPFYSMKHKLQSDPDLEQAWVQTPFRSSWGILESCMCLRQTIFYGAHLYVISYHKGMRRKLSSALQGLNSGLEGHNKHQTMGYLVWQHFSVFYFAFQGWVTVQLCTQQWWGLEEILWKGALVLVRWL